MLQGRAFAVTGGAGFIGRHLVERLVREGAGRVLVLDRRADDARAALGGLSRVIEIHEVILGATPAARIAPRLAGIDGLFHLAAEKHAGGADPAALLTANVLGTEALLDAAAAARVRRVVFASSLYAYGPSSGAPLEESEPPHPATVYGISKIAGELLAARFARATGAEATVLRYFFVHGPGQAAEGRPSLITGTFERLARGESPVLRGDGAQRLDYVYIDDVIEATVRAMAHARAGLTLNVGTGRALPVRDLVRAMQEVAGTRLPVLEDPADDTAGTCRVASVDLAERALGFRARTSVEEGLARTWAARRA